MSISYDFVISLIPTLLLIVVGYLGIKYYEKRAISIISEIVEIEKARIKQDLQTYVNTDDFQKAIYQIGGIIGSGAGAGIGIPKGSGKMSLKNMGIELIGNFIKEKIGSSFPNRPQLGQQNLNRKTLDAIPEAK